MNIKKGSLLLLVAAVLLLALTACDMFHDHVWEYRIAKDATCTEKGLLELLCTDCGEKDYVDLQPIAHNYRDGFCVDCGASVSADKRIEKITMPADADVEGRWSLNAIYDLACTFDYKGSYQSFASDLSGSSLKQASLDNLGLFHVTVTAPTARGGTLETPVVLPVDKVSVNNPHPSLGRLLRADIMGNELIFTYADASQCSAGNFTGDMHITGFGINTAGELVIFYQNNMIAFVGTLG